MLEKQKIYLVKELDSCSEPEEAFWNQYQTLEDAVSDQGDGCEVYEATPKFLGKFDRKVVIVKTKKGKKKNA